MKHISKGLLLALSLVPSMSFAQKTITIDVKEDVHSISPYIYGTNETYEKSTATRWGGNRSTSYNWENNASNGGNDYDFVSDNFYDYTGNTVPAYPILNAAQKADSKGQYSLVSLQAAGYVAADKNGAVTESQIAPSSRWKPISFHKSTPYSLTPDADDDTVYIDELINYLSTKLGRAGDGGISAYAIDNEPYLWSSTHARMHPEQTTPDELIEKTVALSSAIRTLAPGADIYGPMFFGYSDAFHWSSSLSYDSWWTSIQKKCKNYPDVKYSWFVDYYLDTLCGVEKATGVRPVDAIAFHWYPESYGTVTKKRIVDTGNDNVSAAELITDDMIEARLQAPRGLWDSKYIYYGSDGTQSYVCRNSGKAIIKKIKKSIDQFYPGTKIAFTEFEYDAENHWSGGLCLVDVLGVLGREDVYLACKWDVFQTFSTAAYNLYLNYDGNGSQFGTTSVYAMGDTVSLSSYASLDENKNLHIIVVNKTSDVQSTTFNINNGLYTDGVVYGFGQTSSTITQLGTIDNIENSSFTYSLPAYSAVHIILNATPQTELVNAQVVDSNDDEIVLTFKDEVSLASANAAKDEFKVTVNDIEYAVSSVSVSGTNAIVKLANAITTSDNDIAISYNGQNLKGISNLPIEIFDTVFVHNELEGTSIHALSAEINPIGTYITMDFSKSLASVSNNAGLVVKQDDDIVALDSVKISIDSPYELYLYPSSRIFKYKTTTITNENSTDLLAKDGQGLADFSFSLTGGANYSPSIDSMIVADNYTIKVYFSTNMDPDTDYNTVGFSISSTEGDVLFNTAYNKNSRILTFTTEQPLYPNTDYTLSYVDNGEVITIHNGVLESFSSVLNNTLQDMGAKVVNVPSEVIQADEYWFRVGDPVIEECSDTSSLGNGKHLGYISSKDEYTYKINVAETKNYTVYVRYASESNGDLNFILDGESYHLTLPSTKGFKKWKDGYRVLPLTAGEHDLTISIVNSGYNINYIQFAEEEVYPTTTIKRSRVLADGKTLYIFFNTDIAELPTANEIELTANDTTALTITNIDWNSSSVLTCALEETVYKGDVLSISFKSPTIRTVDGGGVQDTTLAVANSSTQIYTEPVVPTEISTIEKEVVVKPVPAKVNQMITIDYPGTASYWIASETGAIITSGIITNSTTISIMKSGTYSIVFYDGNTISTKNFIVR